MDERAKKIEKLKQYFEKRTDVEMAFLFGSQAENRTNSHSDWDVAVYLKPEFGFVEWEEFGRDYFEEDKIWKDIADILKIDDVDLVILNRAPSNIVNTALAGLPLAVKDQSLWLQLLLIISREAEDWHAFSKDYYEIYQRSKSLLKRDQERLRDAITFLDEQSRLYNVYSGFSAADYSDDVRKRNEIERWVENIINAVIDISKIILASSHRLTPQIYRETVERGIWALGLPEEMSKSFEKWVKLRNILAHEYMDIKWKRIRNFIEGEGEVNKFLSASREYLNKHTPSA